MQQYSQHEFCTICGRRRRRSLPVAVNVSWRIQHLCKENLCSNLLHVPKVDHEVKSSLRWWMVAPTLKSPLHQNRNLLNVPSLSMKFIHVTNSHSFGRPMAEIRGLYIDFVIFITFDCIVIAAGYLRVIKLCWYISCVVRYSLIKIKRDDVFFISLCL